MHKRKYNVSYAEIYLILIGSLCIVFGQSSMANENKTYLSSDCAVKKEKNFVDIHILINPPGYSRARVLNLLCDGVTGKSYCSAVLLNPDFLETGNFRDSAIKHIKKVRLEKISQDTADLVWPENHIHIDKLSGDVIWKTNGKTSKSSCIENKELR